MTAQDSGSLPSADGARPPEGGSDCSASERRREVLKRLDPIQRELFEWVCKREELGDWKEFSNAKGRPSPGRVIAQHVKDQVEQDLGEA
jgi:hypothetical protein